MFELNNLSNKFLAMRNLLSFLAAILVLSSCSSSKFDYQTAYRFSHYDYQSVNAEVEENIPAAEQMQIMVPTQENQHVEPLSHHNQSIALLASIKPVTSAIQSLPSDGKLKNYVAREPVTYMADGYTNASKQEKKLIRKKVKLDFKTLRLHMKKAKKDATSQDVVFNRKMFIGAIILGAGILTAILASGEIGAVAIIVGIALLAWGLIEQV